MRRPFYGLDRRTSVRIGPLPMWSFGGRWWFCHGRGGKEAARWVCRRRQCQCWLQRYDILERKGHWEAWETRDEWQNVTLTFAKGNYPHWPLGNVRAIIPNLWLRKCNTSWISMVILPIVDRADNATRCSPEYESVKVAKRRQDL